MSGRFDAAVVGPAHDVAAIAGGVAGTLASRSPARAALVVASGAHRREPALPSTAAARRLRDRVLARDVDARATGRIVWCRPGDVGPAADLHRAATLDAPLVLAVCGPREAWVEPLLDDAAIVLVAGETEDPLTVLALAALDARGLRAAAVAAPSGAGALLARIGLGGPAAWRDALPVIRGASA